MLAGVVGATVGAAVCVGTLKSQTDPQLVFNSRDDPFPYLRRDRQERGKVSGPPAVDSRPDLILQ